MLGEPACVNLPSRGLKRRCGGVVGNSVTAEEVQVGAARVEDIPKVVLLPFGGLSERGELARRLGVHFEAGAVMPCLRLSFVVGLLLAPWCSVARPPFDVVLWSTAGVDGV